MAHISVVIPVYRAEDCIHELYTRLRDSLETITKDFEILLIEDCGGDGSWELIQALCLRDPRVKGYQFSRNFGQHNGITAGIDHCDGDWVIVMDCDLQDQPEEIPNLYAKAQEGFDVVLAARAQRKDSLFKIATSRLFFRVFNYLSDLEYNGNVANFRIISRRVVNAIRPMREHLRFFGALVQWAGFKTSVIEVKHAARFAGESSYTLSKLINLAVTVIVANSDKPLRLSIRLGFLISLFSFFLGSYYLTKKILYGTPVTGWASLIVSLYFLGGIIIGILGILGLYMGRIFEEVKRRPLYIIAERRNDTHNNTP